MNKKEQERWGVAEFKLDKEGLERLKKALQNPSPPHPEPIEEPRMPACNCPCCFVMK